jgi:hypothetical protein
MLTVRRIYLYLVAAISLTVVTWAVIGLARLILSEGIGQGQTIALATMLAAIIVGLPIFLFHWLMAQRLTAKNAEERESIVRRIYFYGMMLVAAAPILSNLYRLVDDILVLLLGGAQRDYYPYNLSVGEHLAAVVALGIIWVYLWRQIQADDRLLPVLETNLIVRRLYWLMLSLAGLIMVTWGAIGLLQSLLQLPTGVAWRTPIADYSAQLLVGAIIWVSHWWLLQQAFFSGQPAEERSVLRKVYLYLAVFVYSVMAVFSLSALLKRLIELALGDTLSSEPLLSQLSLQLPLMVIGAIFWAYHWQVIQQDARLAPDAPRQASVRRIYAYLVATIGLATLLSGLVGLFSLLIDMLTSPATVGLDYYREQVALFVAMIGVGGPIWFIPWRARQALALMPSSSPAADSAGSDERRSIIRKIYLYFYIFIASLAIFGSVGWFVFHLLTALLGADLPEDFITLVLNALVIALLAIGVWLYHGWAIRRDGQLEQAGQARQLADIAVVVIDGEEGQLGQAIIRWLQHDLPGIQLKPIGLTPQAAETMATASFSAALAEAVHQAQYIIGSWQSLSSGEVAAAVTASPALKLVVPLATPKWIWAGVKRQSPDHYARQAVRGIKQAVEGDEITPARDLDMSTIVAIIVGIFVLLFIFVGLFGIFASF